MTRMAELRLACGRDARALLEIYAPIVRESGISFELEAPDAAEMARRIAAIGAPFPRLVAER